MDIGMATASRGACGTRQGYLAVARRAEELGFAFIGVNDHVVVPGGIASRYPYSDDGLWAARTAGECLDQLTALAFIAGATERLRLLTSVMVVPHRHPVLAAKMLASLDVLSGGRLILGCGTGWMEEEFLCLGTPAFAARGRVTDEYLDAFRSLWTEAAPRFTGDHVAFADILFAPKPLQQPHPPIWVGGEGTAAQRRVVARGDGWYPASNNPHHRLDTPARIGAAIAALRAGAEAAGRDPGSIDTALLVLSPVSWTAQQGPDGVRRMLTGRSEDMAADIAALWRSGVRHLNVSLQAPQLSETLERMERFATEVMPLAR
jgi:probable F420-dependent oxidoreductase